MTSTVAAAPSVVGPHMSTVFGLVTMGDARISSSENAFRYIANGLSTEFRWFFSAISAKTVSGVSGYRRT